MFVSPFIAPAVPALDDAIHERAAHLLDLQRAARQLVRAGARAGERQDARRGLRHARRLHKADSLEVMRGSILIRIDIGYYGRTRSLWARIPLRLGFRDDLVYGFLGGPVLAMRYF